MTAYVSTLIAPVFALGTYSILSSIRHTTPLLSASAFSILTILALLSQASQTFIDAVHGLFTAAAGFTRVQEYLAEVPRSDSRVRLWPESLEEVCADEQAIGGTEPVPAVHEIIDQEKCLAQQAVPSCVTMQQCYMRWSEESAPVLSNVTCRMPLSSVTVVVGPVACGKSTLLQAILGEVPFVSGNVQIGARSFAYCRQNPWIFNGTVKENIIAENAFESAWYQKVVSVCELEADLRQLQDGEDTIVGSNGSALSGGQRARVVSRSPIVPVLVADIDRP